MNAAGLRAGRELLVGVGFMIGSAAMFACMAAMIRLASSELHAFEIAFFRNLFGLAFALPLLLHHGFGILKTDKQHVYIGRCLIGIVSMLCGFYAIVHLPLAKAVTISYSTPLFVTILAVLFLGEIVRARRWAAVGVGFLGVMVIMRPGADTFDAITLVALTAAVLSAIVAVSIKVLSRTEKPDAIVLWTTLLWVPMALVPALFVWTGPSGWTWVWVIGAGFFGTAGHMFWTRALKRGDASMLTSISFVQVPFVAVLAWWLFDEAVTAWTAAGAAIIFVATAYIAQREARVASRAVTDTEISPETQKR